MSTSDFGFYLALGASIVGIAIWASSMFYLEMRKKQKELNELRNK